jgi:hypothetical protein
MRYELYGITQHGGAVLEVSAHRSRIGALRAVEEINSNVYTYFMVLETPRKTAVPLGFLAGRVRDGFASISQANYVRSGPTPGKGQILTQDYVQENIIKRMVRSDD